MADYNNNTNKNLNNCIEITKKTTGIAEILAKKCTKAKPVLNLHQKTMNILLQLIKNL